MHPFLNCLTQQISELNLLKSMYPNRGEIAIADENNLNNINKFINGESEFLPNHLEFVINLLVNQLKLEICVNLPPTYPNEEPNIYIRCNRLNRHQESNLNTKLNEHLDKIKNGDVCLYSAIAWIQENINAFAETQENESCNLTDPLLLCFAKKEQFTRFWIYSHHIYNKKKRDEITKKARDLKLNGFCLPGKPGVICVEGDESACKEWWQSIKSMNWKKIVLRKVETFDPSEGVASKKFNSFEELHFQVSANAKHSNMSEFSKFMNKHAFSEIFNEIFGLND